jgi:hypothetical protein
MAIWVGGNDVYPANGVGLWVSSLYGQTLGSLLTDCTFHDGAV